MKHIAPIAIAALFAAPVGAVHAQDASQTRAGVAAVEQWLTLADAGQGAESWHAASSAFRGAIGQQAWAGALQAARAPLGALKTRTLANARLTHVLPGMPEGDYVVIQYHSTFANRAGMTETLVAMREADGSWKTATYLIQ